MKFINMENSRSKSLYQNFELYLENLMDFD